MIGLNRHGILYLIIFIIIIGAYNFVGGFSYHKPKVTTTDAQLQTPVETASSNTEILQDKPTCSHFDGICHPLAEALCCDRVRALCANKKCNGFLPPESTYKVGDPTPTIDPQCGLDSMCESTCDDKEGFLCL